MLRNSYPLLAAAILLAGCSSNDDYDYGTDADTSGPTISAPSVGESDRGIGSDTLDANQPEPGT